MNIFFSLLLRFFDIVKSLGIIAHVGEHVLAITKVIRLKRRRRDGRTDTGSGA